MIILGSDHGGFELKEYIRSCLQDAGYDVYDAGCYNTDSVDYPDIAKKVADAVAAKEYECGILFCGTGIGISIAANKVKGIRAAHCTDPFSAKLARQHNNANIIALGGRITGNELAWEIVQSYLNAEFLGGRHQKRVDKITALER